MPRQQRGVALVMALVMLLILTILGITAMNTSSLEEKMSGNVQESTRSFQAAESGVNSALKDTGALDPNASTTKNYSYAGQKSGSATVITSFTQYTPPRRSEDPSQIYSSSNLQSAHFKMESTGTTITGAETVIEQGIDQVVTKSD